MSFLRSLHSVKGLKRFGAITGVLIKHGFEDIVDWLFTGMEEKPKEFRYKEFLFRSGFPSPQRIRLVLQELGPSFIKLGQLLSTRTDVFPPEYIEEFNKLQDRVPPVLFREVKLVIEEELNRPLSEIFTEFSPKPIGSASVAQVHEARVFNGEKVAVKVVRPGINKTIREDIPLMYFIAEKIEAAFEMGRILGITNLVREFERTIFKELDMFIEAGNIEKFAHHFKDVDEIRIPRVYWDITSKSVLTMEYIEGVKMDQVEAIRAYGIDPKEIAMIGLRSFSRQLMDFGFFHADPHPGNTIVMPDGRVGLVDFGITGYLDEEVMLQVANIFLGYAEHDYDMVMGGLLDAGLINEETMDLKSFRTDLKDISEPFYGRSLQTVSVKEVYDLVMQLVMKYHIRLPRNLLLLLKTFIQTEALGKILGSDASILQVTKPYAKKLIRRGYEARKVFRNITRDARTISLYLKMMPKFIHDLLRQASQGKLKMELSHSGFKPLDTRFEKGVNRLTVGMVISASILAAAHILNATKETFEISIGFLGIRIVSLTALFALTGYTIATVLGLWLIISILRSGKL